MSGALAGSVVTDGAADGLKYRPPSSDPEIWNQAAPIIHVPRLNYEVKSNWETAAFEMSMAPGCVAVELVEVPADLDGFGLPTAVSHKTKGGPSTGVRAKLRYQPHVGVVVAMGAGIGNRVPPPSRDLHLGAMVLVAHEHGTRWLPESKFGDYECKNDLVVYGRKYMRDEGGATYPAVCDWRRSIMAVMTDTKYEGLKAIEAREKFIADWRPVGDLVLLEVEPNVERSKGGLYLPKSLQYSRMVGRVRKQGPDAKNFWPDVENGLSYMYDGSGFRQVAEFGCGIGVYLGSVQGLIGEVPDDASPDWGFVRTDLDG